MSILTEDDTFRIEVLKRLEDAADKALESMKRKRVVMTCDLTDLEIKMLIQWKVLRQLKQHERYLEICGLFKFHKPGENHG